MVATTAALKWRSQLCPCGYCPPGTRVYWRYAIDIHFAKSTEGPRRRVSGGPVSSPATMQGKDDSQIVAANPSGLDELKARALPVTESGHTAQWPYVPPRARTRNGRKALEGPEAGER